MGGRIRGGKKKLIGWEVSETQMRHDGSLGKCRGSRGGEKWTWGRYTQEVGLTGAWRLILLRWERGRGEGQLASFWPRVFGAQRTVCT